MLKVYSTPQRRMGNLKPGNFYPGTVSVQLYLRNPFFCLFLAFLIYMSDLQKVYCQMEATC